MTYRFREARERLGLSPAELARKLEVEVSNIHNWELGRRQPKLERLLQIAQVLNCSVAFLLGLPEEMTISPQPISKEQLPLLNNQPVWLSDRGWALVNASLRQLIFSDHSVLDFTYITEDIYAFPPLAPIALAQGWLNTGAPLHMDALLSRTRVWVEPLSQDEKYNNELRGWYHLRQRRLVENELGNRFYLDNYGVKWLAFAGEERPDQDGQY